MTMTDSRTSFGKEIDALIRQAYGGKIKVFAQGIPRSVRAAETSAEGRSIYAHDSKGKVAEGLPGTDEGGAAKCRKNGANISLTSYDDIFSTEESRQTEQIQQIPIAELHPLQRPPLQGAGR